MPQLEPESVTKELSCKLTEDELIERGDSLASERIEVERLKLVRKDLNAKIGDHDDAISKLAKVVKDRAEMRPVLCKWIEYTRENCFKCIRQDTGDEVDVRAMTADDLQEGMNFDQGDSEPDAPMRENVDEDPFGEPEPVEPEPVRSSKSGRSKGGRHLNA